MNQLTFPLKLGMRGEAVVDLQDGLLLLLEKAALPLSDSDRASYMEAMQAEHQEGVYGEATNRLVAWIQVQEGLTPEGDLDEPTAKVIEALLAKMAGSYNLLFPSSSAIREATLVNGTPLRSKPVTYRVEGKVASHTSAAVGGLRVRVVDKNVAQDYLLAEVVTDTNGAYRASFTDVNLRQRGKERPDLQARVYFGQRFIGSSEVRYNAGPSVTLHVRLDEKAAAFLHSEHETVTAAIITHYKGSLSDLKETDERPDITYLANKTGWDARAVALSALAAQFSARTRQSTRQSGIDPAFFYALFRAGLPANEETLYQASAKTLTEIWDQAATRGIIPHRLRKSIPAVAERFQQVAAMRALDAPALVGLSPLRAVVAVSLGDDLEMQQAFADLHTRYRNDLPRFWAAVTEKFGDTTAGRLRLDGQLAFLTLNNAPLMRRLHDAVGKEDMTDPVFLAAAGFHRAEAWQEIIGKEAIPKEIPGDSPEAKRSRYAELMAAQVRLSFPTAVVAHMVRTAETPLAEPELAITVHDFLMEHQGKFEIGRQPIQQYMVHNKAELPEAATREIMRIQRVYQITPGDEAMNALLRAKIDSAREVLRFEPEEFVQTFKAEVGGEANAQLIYAKSQQVHNAVLNIAVSYMTASQAPGVGVHSPAQIVDPAPTGPNPGASDVIAYSTLETLFGGMDYCDCQQCRTILSPAAYLVDLLQFLDRPAAVIPAGKSNPQTVLLERRPDIQHLPLTCENTNTPVPYIDLVNETLEYYVTNHLSLSGYKGHDTDGTAAAAELLANPQFVSDKAYEILAGRPAQVSDPTPLLPPTAPLPLHQPLEQLRRYFDRLEAPLPTVMEALRKNDNLERASESDYGWRDIFMEELHLSRAEHKRLTDSTMTLQALYGYAPATATATVVSELSHAKQFARRLGIKYEALFAILKSRFVNPNATLVPKLERLGVPFATLKAFKDGTLTNAEFDAALAPGIDPAQYGGDIKAWVKNATNYANIMSLITLTNPTHPDDVCNMDEIELRYANPDNAANKLKAFEFVRLARFIRLWKKLGWTVEQTDKALAALYPAAQTPNDPSEAVNLTRLDAGMKTALPRLGVVKRAMDRLNLNPRKDLLPLLACVAPIDTDGAQSLYRQMFLSPALLEQDGAFADDGYGHFLSGSEKLLAHGETLRAAFQLTATAFDQITGDLGYTASTPLTVENISAVFRRGWLARKLKLSVPELNALIQFTGLDPFAAPDLTSKDPATPSLLRLIELVERLRAASVKPAEALYLVWNQDISGKSTPSDSETLAFARTLRTGFAAIESEFNVTQDPDGQIARAKMALVYGNEATEQFFGLLENKAVTDVAYTHATPALAQAILDAAPGALAYDSLGKRLAYTVGVMPAATRSALKLVPGVTNAFKDAVDALYTKTRAFFGRYPELESLFTAYTASTAEVEQKRADLLANFLPQLKLRRKHEQGLQAVGAAARATTEFATAVLDSAPVLHAAGSTTTPAVSDLTAIETPGLSAQFYFRDTATGTVDLTRAADGDLAYAAGSSHTLPPNATTPGSAISGIWSGYLEAPENGLYNLRIDSDAATVALTLGDTAVTLDQNGTQWNSHDRIELKAGTLYAFTLKAEKVKDSLSVRWETLGRGFEVIPGRCLYGATPTTRLREVYVRFLKAAALASALKVTPAEAAWLAASGWLNSLPVTGSPNATTAESLFQAFRGLIDFARIKADLSPDDELLLAVLKDPAAATAQPDSLLYTLTRWEPASLTALLGRFGKTVSQLAQVETFRRVYDAYSFVRQMGIPATALISAATNEPVATTVRDLQAALRARYAENDWLDVIKPINDEMRSLQRDGLVAYILHQMQQSPASAHIDTPEKLFEYFLMDVEMEPVMQTSRIRHALSSVQLFIERCLMNLEPRVAPSSLKAKHWQWMSRYRVWEANRKVFLYPENWLEPELRDDQSPFFKETMSELLQTDMNEESAATALLNYLSKLEEVAKLEPCGIHYVENDPDKVADDVAHVVARTAGANRKYYYRRREYGYWTPWEQIKLDVEDDPVIPVVWKNRLFLFWLRIMQKPQLQKPPTVASGSHLSEVDASTLLSNDAGKVTITAILCWSEYYNGKWQPTKTSNVNRPTALDTMDPTAFDRSKLQLSASEVDDALVIGIAGTGSSSFTLYNTHSLPVDTGEQFYLDFGPSRSLDTSGEIFQAHYYPVLSGYGPGGGTPLARPIIRNSLTDRVVAPNHSLLDPWNAPFFYEDSRHVFYVTTAERTVTVSSWTGYTPGVVVEKPDLHLPDLVHQEPDILDPGGPITMGPGFGVTDPSPVDRFVTEDAYISRAFGTPGTVQFGDKQIGPSGSITIATQMR